MPVLIGIGALITSIISAISAFLSFINQLGIKRIAAVALLFTVMGSAMYGAVMTLTGFLDQLLGMMQLPVEFTPLFFPAAAITCITIILAGDVVVIAIKGLYWFQGWLARSMGA